MKTKLTFVFVCLCIFANLSNAQNSSPMIELSTNQLEIPSIKNKSVSEADAVARMYVSVKVGGVSEKVKNGDYKYTVSGGQIVGEGNNVQWNLYGVKPETYTINLEISENGKIKTATQSILVTDELVCPLLNVTASKEQIKIGESVIFEANVSGGTLDVKGYRWMLSSGIIVKGQDTSKIEVKPDPASADKSITAIVEINLNNGICPNTTSETVQVKKDN
ncbi:MAG TPA: hypothetical protein PKY59_15105 [Pyrinomonadaceae bacterium]|nr:hypothetical protein [Pyrinomonadaceae bacterium]